MNTCVIVDDLLPIYYDNLVKDETKEFVEMHLATCSECKKRYINMNTELTVDTSDYSDDYLLAKKIVSSLKKKIFFILIGIIVAVLLFFVFITGLIIYGKSTQDSYYTKSIHDYGNYEGHIESEYEMMHSALLVFPEKNIVEQYGSNYEYECGISSFAGNRYCIMLTCIFDEAGLRVERERLENIKLEYNDKCKNILKVNMNEKSDFYVSIIEEYGRKEYAFVDGNKIIYVFEQFCDTEDDYLTEEQREVLDTFLETNGEYNLYLTAGQYHNSIIDKRDF